MRPDPRPYLTIVAWPEGHGREDVAQLLANAAGLDLPSLRLQLGQAPPMILGQVDANAARQAIEALRAKGGDAFGSTLEDLQRLGPTMKIRDLRLIDGNLDVDLWRGPSTTIRRERIQILVRAHLSTTTTEMLRSPHAAHIYADTIAARPQARMLLAYGAGGAAGLAIGFASGYLTNIGDFVDHSVQTSDKLDLHTVNGSVYQIDGDKFGYRVLGEMRGHSDKANMDAMCELLKHIAPDPIVDTFFSLWRPPPACRRLRLPDMKINNEDPQFAFYSRWAALLYRHVMGGGSPG